MVIWVWVCSAERLRSVRVVWTVCAVWVAFSEVEDIRDDRDDKDEEAPPAEVVRRCVASWAWLAPSYAVDDGKKLWWVRGLACEMKSVASMVGKTLYVNGWGFAQNQPGRQIPTVAFAQGLKRYDKDGDGLVGKAEVVGDTPMDKMLAGDYGFPAFDLDRDDKLDSREWDVAARCSPRRTACSPSRLAAKET